MRTTPPECSCGGIDAVPHATDHAPDCSIWDDLPVLGLCPHGVDLDREFCPEGCRV